MDIFNEQEDDLLTKRLKYQILEKKGKLPKAAAVEAVEEEAPKTTQRQQPAGKKRAKKK